MAAKSYEELMAENHRKQKQLKEEEKDLKKKHAEELKKKRIARHIKIGELVESILGREFTEEDFELFEEFLNRRGKNGSFFETAMRHEQE